MRMFALLGVVGLALAVLLPAGMASGQELPPGPTTILTKRFEAASLPGPVELVQVVADVPPSAGVAAHTHGGQVFVTVVEGALTVRGGGGERTYPAGEAFVEQPGDSHSVVNATASNTRLLITYVLPQGAPATTLQEGAPAPATGPTPVAQGTYVIANPPPQFEVVQALLDFAPGAWTPAHSHGGPVLVTVLEGQVTERRPGVERRFGPGEGWTENEGDVHAAGNDSGAKASVVASFLLRRGAQLTTVQAVPLGPAPAAAQPAPAAAPARQPAALPAAPAPAPAQVPRAR
jgi:quercetin dioxygenase-like cupin family protein